MLEIARELEANWTLALAGNNHRSPIPSFDLNGSHGFRVDVSRPYWEVA
ncbi:MULTISPECIES: hypothetical protein [Streptomyces]|nr:MULTISPECIES: hypothetical protein [Streptomyces]MCX5037939.1 hypothetical protein [Streptomyces coelicoflavus]